MSDERNFMELFHARQAEDKFVCIGLDSDWEKLPGTTQDSWSPRYKGIEGGLFAFNKAIIDATIDIACAYKPNLAFYQMWGDLGIKALEATISYILGLDPAVPVILDAKYGDIGNTNNGYARFAFDRASRERTVVEDGQKRKFTLHGADAVTVHNYMGHEAMAPFLKDANKGVFVLCRTSNPGGGEFQDLEVDIGEQLATEWGLSNRTPAWVAEHEVITWPRLKLYQVVAHKVSRDWNASGNCAVVVGATRPEELGEVRQIIGDMPILIPGVGAQGGDLVASVHAGLNTNRQGILINAGSADLFASKGRDFSEAARKAIQQRNGDILAARAA